MEFPLAWHDLGVGARDLEAGFDAPVGVKLDKIATGDLKCADTAVVRTLWAREATWRKAVWPLALRVEQRVLLLEPEPGLLISVLVLIST